MTQSGKVAFITGGLGGIGLSFGENFLQQGAKVALIDIIDGTDIGKELKKKYGEDRVIALQCDITVIQQLRDSYQKTVDTFGGLDIVINCAGIVNEVNYERTIAVNLTALITSSYMAVERMRKDKSGRGGTLINIASVAGLETLPTVLAYSASKGGVISFSKSLVANLGDGETTGIKVGTICPGRVDGTNVAFIVSMPEFQESDITQPNVQESKKRMNTKTGEMKGLSPQGLSDVLMKYLAEPNLHGSVIVVDRETARYVHPPSLDGQKLMQNE